VIVKWSHSGADRQVRSGYGLSRHGRPSAGLRKYDLTDDEFGRSPPGTETLEERRVIQPVILRKAPFNARNAALTDI